MKKPSIILIVLYFLVLSYSSSCFAAGNPTHYKMTLKECRVKNKAGQWITISSPNQVIDIATANANSMAGAVTASMNIPDGEYVNFMTIFSNVITFAGDDGGGNFTKTCGGVTATGNDIAAASSHGWVGDTPNATPANNTTASSWAGAAQEIDFTLTLGAAAGRTGTTFQVYRFTDFSPITINSSSKISLSFSFNTIGTVGSSGGVMYLLPPKSGTSCVWTIDGVTYSTTAADMTMEFNM